MILARVIELLVVQIWQVAIVGLMVWVIVASVASDRPHLAHALWALALLKCVTPPIWSSPTSPFSWWCTNKVETVEFQSRQPSAAPIAHDIPPFQATAQPAEHLIPAVGFPSLPSTPLWRLPSAKTSLVGIWIVGVLASLVRSIIRLVRLNRLVRRQRIATPAGLETQVKSLARSLGMSERVRVHVLDAQFGPAVMGCWRPAILLPKSIASGTYVSELEPLLAHELIHIRRGDLYMAVLQTLAKAFLWFHPVVWLASRQVDRESERCCDEETIASLGCAPGNYARMLLDVLEAKHRLRVIPALPGVRPVEVTANRLERVMRFGNGYRNGIHTRRPCWVTAAFVMGAMAILPGAARVIGQDRALPRTNVGSDSRLETRPSENNLLSKELNYARQITIETKLLRVPSQLINDLKLAWQDESDECAHCVLDEDATQELLTLLAGEDTIGEQEAAFIITLFDGGDLRFQNVDQRTFVTSWEPFPGQENQPVRTLSPVTEEFEFGLHVRGHVKCIEAGNDIRITIQHDRTYMASVETSQFHFAQDIGGEPHPIQTPKLGSQEQAVEARLPIHASLVMRQPDHDGKTSIAIFVYKALHETPEVAVKAASFLSTRSNPSSVAVLPAAAVTTIDEKVPRVPVAKIYVDSGVDFTPEQTELIASQHDRLGFESVQIKEGRLRVLAQDLAHIETARNMVASKRPGNRPLIRGGESKGDFDYTLLTEALASSHFPSRIMGHVDYTINREHVELRASPMEVSYTDSEQSFRLRGDRGEIRLKPSTNDYLGIQFSGNVAFEYGDLKVTADAIETTDEINITLTGHIVIQHGNGRNALRLDADELTIDLEKWDSIEEFFEHVREKSH